MPEPLRPFFRKYRSQVVEHAIDPDLWRNAGFEEEPPRHFLDMDSFGPYPFTELPHDYDQAVAKFGRDMVRKNGLLPWRARGDLQEAGRGVHQSEERAQLRAREHQVLHLGRRPLRE